MNFGQLHYLQVPVFIINNSKTRHCILPASKDFSFVVANEILQIKQIYDGICVIQLYYRNFYVNQPDSGVFTQRNSVCVVFLTHCSAAAGRATALQCVDVTPSLRGMDLPSQCLQRSRSMSLTDGGVNTIQYNIRLL